MKIIDLLNKIANGEEVPNKIEYNNIDYFWCNQCKIYERFEDDSKDLYNDLDNLNDEIEIIEEEKKIPEKLEETSNIGDLTITYPSNKELMDKINEIIDYIKNKEE